MLHVSPSAEHWKPGGQHRFPQVKDVPELTDAPAIGQSTGLIWSHCSPILQQITEVPESSGMHSVPEGQQNFESGMLEQMSESRSVHCRWGGSSTRGRCLEGVEDEAVLLPGYDDGCAAVKTGRRNRRMREVEVAMGAGSMAAARVKIVVESALLMVRYCKSCRRCQRHVLDDDGEGPDL